MYYLKKIHLPLQRVKQKNYQNMLQSLENQTIFANPMTLRFGMETITLSYEPGSDFAVALEELIRNSEGVRVVKRSVDGKQMEAIEKTLSPKERKAAYQLAESVKKSLKEIDAAASKGDHVGRNVEKNRS